MTRRRAITTPGTRREPGRRGVGGLAVSLVIHAAAIALLVRVVILPPDWLRAPGTSDPLPVDRIGFLALPRSDQPSTRTPRSGGDNRPVTTTPAPPVVAPPTVPTELPVAPPTVRPVEPGGAGPVVGAGGAAEGVRPSFSDPRIWAPAAPIVVAPMSPRQVMDSAIAARIGALEDSLRAIPRGREPGDWTVTRGGKKYGIDPHFIHLGDFSLPTAVLAMLPLNVTANPAAVERDRRLSAIRGEIQEQAARAARDEDFRAAVKSLRERKQRERDDEKKKKAAEPPKVVPASP